MLLIASLMAGGSLSSSLFFLSHDIAIAAITTTLLFLVSVFIFIRHPSLRRGVTLGFFVFMVGVALAWFWVANSNNISVPLNTKYPLLCEAVVKGPASVRAWGGMVDVSLVACSQDLSAGLFPAHGDIRLNAEQMAFDLMPGERVRFQAKFNSVREYKNPGGFSYRQYLIVHGIGATGWVYGKIERLGGENLLLSSVEKLRRKIADDVRANVEAPAMGVILALANGDQDEIDSDLRNTFSSTGLAHLLAISGMNVGYVAVFLYFLSRFIFGFFPILFLRVPLRVLSAIVTLPAIWVYVLLTGLAISAIRAAIMLTVFLFGIIISRRQDILSTLSTAVVVLLAFLPLSVLDVSFELSVVAVAGIVLVVPVIVNKTSFQIRNRNFAGKCFNWFYMLIAVTLAATVATFPLVAYHFKFVSVISLVANLIAVPVTGVILSPVVAVASAISIFASSLAGPLWKLSGIAGILFIDFAKKTEELGGALVFRWAPNTFEVICIYFFIASVLYWKKLKFRKAIIVILAVIFVTDIGYWRVLPYFDNRFSITIFDVGQGDSALLRFPGAKTMLIDGGGIRGSDFDIGRNVLAPALWRMGIHRIDSMLLTHPHYDHYRGLATVAKLFHPKAIWTNGLDAADTENGDWQMFLKELNQAGVPVKKIDGSKVTINLEDVTLNLIKVPHEKNVDMNDTSIVVEVLFKGAKFLFTGDLTEKKESKLLSMIDAGPVSFLKVGHHGSKDATSQSFVDAIRPRIATISAGERNHYGLPNVQVLKRLENAGSQIFRTDKDGAITIKSNGRDLKVETFIAR